MLKHSLKLALSFIAFAVIGLGPAIRAQNTATESGQQAPSPPANINTPHQILVTGCLKRGNEAGGYYIKDQNGKTWELVSGSSGIDLSAHVQHAVTITGKEVTTPKDQEAAKQPSESAEGNPHSDLRVLTLKMLSPSCTR